MEVLDVDINALGAPNLEGIKEKIENDDDKDLQLKKINVGNDENNNELTELEKTANQNISQSVIQQAPAAPLKYQNIPIDSIRNLFINHSCSAFNFYEAIHYTDENTEQPIYILQLKFLDPPNDPEQYVTDLVNNMEKQYELKYTSPYLSKIGYHFNINENILYLIYARNGHSFALEDYFNNKSIKKSKDKNLQKLFLLQTFHDIIRLVSEIHKSGRKMGILHPKMLFMFKKRELGVIDMNLDDMIKPIDKFKNFNVCSFFGYFDINSIDSIDENLEFYQKTDIVLLCLLLVYLVLIYEDRIKITYENLVHLLQKDYLTANGNFTSLLTILDEDVKNLVKSSIRLETCDNAMIEKFRSNFEKILINRFEGTVCCECKAKCVGTFFKLDYICFDILCKSCFSKNKHKCKETMESIELKETLADRCKKYSAQITKIEDMINHIPEIESKNVYEFYKSSMNDVFSDITKEHLKIERLIQLEEEKLNSILNYTEDTIVNKFKEDGENINLSLTNFKNFVVKINREIEKLNRWEKCDWKVEQSDERISNVLEKNKKIREILDKNTIDANYNPLNEQLKDFSSFVENAQEFKKVINFNMKINNALESIEEKSNNYIEELKKLYSGDFSHSIKFITDETTKLVNMPFLDKSSVLRESRLLSEFHEAIGTIQAEKNKLSFLYDYNKIHSVKVLFGNKNSTDKILKHSRYVNLKTRLFITGGVTIDRKLMIDVPSTFAFSVDFFDGGKFNPERKARILPEMKVARDQHTMIKVNDFFVLSIGGTQTNTCEMFDLNRNEWTMKPSLNKIRFNSSVFFYNQTDLYVFFGVEGNSEKRVTEFNYLVDIERLNIYSVANEWELLQVKFDEIITLKQFSMNGIVPSDEDIIILGGKINSDLDYSKNFYKFNFNELSLKLMTNRVLGQNISFIDPNFIKMQFKDENSEYMKSQWVSYSPEPVFYAIDIF